MITHGESIRSLIKSGASLLTESEVVNARRNAEWMLCRALDCSVLDLYVRANDIAGAAVVAEYSHMLRRRALREPLQHILGSTEFYSLPFDVEPGVFVPRPETETLVEVVERALRARPVYERLAVADLCCGTGVIGIALAHRIPNLEVTAVDLNPAAVALTRRNARRNGVSNRLHAYAADAMRYIAGRDGALPPFSAILCNPPYIETAEMPTLAPEVRDYDPPEALDGGADGLDFYRGLAPILCSRLTASGFVSFEIGHRQADPVRALLASEGFARVEVSLDIAGRNRVVTAWREDGDG